jgi:hypothetical protein
VAEHTLGPTTSRLIVITASLYRQWQLYQY